MILEEIEGIHTKFWQSIKLWMGDGENPYLDKFTMSSSIEIWFGKSFNWWLM